MFRALRYFVKPTPIRFLGNNMILRFHFCNTQSAQNPELLEEVKEKVFQVMKSAAKCKTDKLTEKATFEDLGFDSLDSVEMVVALEENFGFGKNSKNLKKLDITNEEAEKIIGVGDAITIFYKYCQDKIAKDSVQKK